MRQEEGVVKHQLMMALMVVGSERSIQAREVAVEAPVALKVTRATDGPGARRLVERAVVAG